MPLPWMGRNSENLETCWLKIGFGASLLSNLGEKLDRSPNPQPYGDSLFGLWVLGVYAEQLRESLQRLFTGDCGSGWIFENDRFCAIGMGGFAQVNSRRRLPKNIESLKQAGKGAREVFKDGAWACWLKFREKMVLSHWTRWWLEWLDSHTRTRRGCFEKG